MEVLYDQVYIVRGYDDESIAHMPVSRLEFKQREYVLAKWCSNTPTGALVALSRVSTNTSCPASIVLVAINLVEVLEVSVSLP